MPSYLTGWSNRVRIIIDHSKITEALADFPVAVHISASCGADSQDLSAVFDELTSDANRKKIAVTTSDGLTQCYVEVDYWDDATESAVLHVKVPNISAGTDTILYLYYDADQADNSDYVGDPTDTPAQSVWDSNFAFVHHMNEDPSGGAGSVKDSTANGNHTTPSGTMLTEDLVDGFPGKGLDFDGSNDGLYDSAGYDANGDTEGTVEAVFNPRSYNAGGKDGLIVSWTTTTNYGHGLDIDDGNIRGLFVVSTSAKIATGGAISLDTDQYAAGSWKSGEVVNAFLNDAKTTGTSGTGTLSRSGAKWELAEDTLAGFAGREFDGVISELRASKTKRSDAWINATYYGLFDTLVSYDTGADFLSGFKNRVQINIDNTLIDEAVVDFPVTLHLSSSAGIGADDTRRIFEKLQIDDNRKKIAVTTANGQTQCYVDIEYWSQANNEAYLHVKVPAVASDVDTILYLYFDNSADDNTTYVGDTGDAAAQAVWDSDFVAVYHLAKDPSVIGNVEDATGNGNDSTATTLLAGDLEDSAIGQGIDFSGSGFATIADNASLDTMSGDITIEALFNHLNNPASGRFCGRYTSDGPDTGWMLLIQSAGGLKFDGRDGGGVYRAAGATATVFDDGNWHYAVGRRASTVWEVRGDDATAGKTATDTCSAGGDASGNGAALYIGKGEAAGGFPYNGELDEVRLSKTARSDAWLLATYHSLLDTLVTYSNFESSEFKKRRKITIDSTLIDATLTDFPLAIALNTTAGTGAEDLTDIFAELAVNANRFKIKVTLDDLVTECPVEIEYFDVATLTGMLHTKIPSISSSGDTDIYLHYDRDQPDNPNVGEPGDTIAQTVWDADFEGVYHLAQDPTGGAGAILDSTSNGRDMTANNMEAGDLIDTTPGRGFDFDGSNEMCYVNVSGVMTAYPGTLEVAGPATVTGASNNCPAIGIGDKDVSDQMAVMNMYGTIGRLNFYSGSTNVVDGIATLSADEFVHLAAVLTDATDRSLFTNGADEQNDIDSDVWPSGVDRFAIGATPDSTIGYRAGKVGEARFSSIARSDAWIKATYNTLADSLIAWAAAEGSWLGTWAKRRLFTIDSSLVDAELRDFPVTLLIDASAGIGADDLSGIFTDISTANKKKIAIATADKVTECYFEIEVWDSTGDKAAVHVRIPVIDASNDTELYLYYDNAQGDNARAGEPGDAIAQNVWDDDFLQVLHMYDDTTLKSSVDGTTMTLAGTLALVDGPHSGKALQANDDGDYIDHASLAFTNNFTIEAQAYLDTGGPNPGYDQIMGEERSISIMMDHTSGTNWGLYMGNNSVWDTYKPSSSNLSESTWYNLAAIYNAGAYNYYKDGVADGSGSGTSRSVTTVFHIFRRENAATGAYRLHGKIAEFRISAGSRSAAWLKSTHETLDDTFGTWSAEEINPYGGEDVYAVLGAPGEITFTVNQALAGVGVDMGAPGEITFTAQQALAGVGVDTGIPSDVNFNAQAATVVQNFNAIGIMSKPNVSGKGPSIRVTGRGPSITVAGKGPSISVTSKGD